MAVNIHITIIELNALHTKRQNLFQELDAVIHLLMEAKHWGLRKSRNATSLNSRFKSLDTLKVKIISVTFRRVIRTNHKKASKIWRHENIQLGGCQRSEERFSGNAETDLVCRLLLEKKKKKEHTRQNKTTTEVAKETHTQYSNRTRRIYPHSR